MSCPLGGDLEERPPHPELHRHRQRGDGDARPRLFHGEERQHEHSQAERPRDDHASQPARLDASLFRDEVVLVPRFDRRYGVADPIDRSFEVLDREQGRIEDHPGTRRCEVHPGLVHTLLVSEGLLDASRTRRARHARDGELHLADLAARVHVARALIDRAHVSAASTVVPTGGRSKRRASISSSTISSTRPARIASATQVSRWFRST